MTTATINIEALKACYDQNLPLVVARWIKEGSLTNFILTNGKLVSLGLYEWQPMTYQEQAKVYQVIVDETNYLKTKTNCSKTQSEWADLIMVNFLLQTDFDHEGHSVMAMENKAARYESNYNED
jgi:hypothetical protein